MEKNMKLILVILLKNMEKYGEKMIFSTFFLPE